jgi:hypothetical protein
MTKKVLEGIVKVGRCWNEVWVRPDRISTVDTAGVSQRRPQVRSIAHPARPQLKSHQRCERLFCRTARGAGAAHSFGQGAGGGHPLGCRLTDHLVHPTFDKRQHGFQPLQGGPLFWGFLGLEQAAFDR